MHTIGEVARLTGLKVPTIRFYEAEGLVPAPPRTESGRRLYADAAVRRLAFIRHARGLGFELDDIRSLLDLTDAPDRPCADADQIARRHLAAVEARIAQLAETCVASGSWNNAANTSSCAASAATAASLV